jgi:hypothetical protein
VAELRTGDLARRLPDGVYELIGRKSRFAKVFGLRLDLDSLERVLGETGISGRCVEQGGRICAFVTRHRDVDAAQSALARHCGLPRHAVRAAHVVAHPVTASGKTDYAALVRQAELLDVAPTPSRGSDTVSAEGLRDLYAELLGRPDATVESTFVGLGGDSLSYVEVSVRLSDLLGTLPRTWPTMTLQELAQPTDRPPKRGALLDTTVLLRAAAILLIVGTHANLFTLYGGAHILLGVAGYNFARFQLGVGSRTGRLRNGLGSVAQVAVPSMIWIACVGITTGMYVPETALMLNGLVGSDTWTLQWQFWFLEALVWTVLACVAVLAIPPIHRLERASPWGFAVGVLAAGLALRYGLVGLEAGPVQRYSVLVVFWCFALGWAAAKATGTWQRAIVSLVALAAVPGSSGARTRGGRPAGFPGAAVAARRTGTEVAEPGRRVGRRRLPVHLPHALAGLPAPRAGPPVPCGGRVGRRRARCGAVGPAGDAPPRPDGRSPHSCRKSLSARARSAGASSAMWWPDSIAWPRRSSAHGPQTASGSP